MLQNLSVLELENKALWVRRKVLEMAVTAKGGHVSTALSQVEILVTLYFGGIFKYDPKQPKSADKDVLILSKGHGAIGLYPVLAAAGFFPEEWLLDVEKRGSFVGGNTTLQVPGVDYLSWSIGHGLPIATGVCQAFLNDNKANHVFCLTGDAELLEGSNWEAMAFANWNKLGNLTVIVDRNGQGTLGKTDSRECLRDGVGLELFDAKFKSFGFECVSVDGHDIKALLTVLTYARETRKHPLAIIAHTKKGKGLSVMEDKRHWHWTVPKGVELTQCWQDLKVDKTEGVSSVTAVDKNAYGMRDRFFDALFPLFQQDKNRVLITADCGAPSLDKYAELSGQYYQVGVAEQEMIGLAVGMALQGKRPYCYALTPFLTSRVHEFLKLDCAAMNLPVCLVSIGAGLCYDKMGPTHHSVEDIAIMRCLPNFQIYSPSDGYIAAGLATHLAMLSSPSYIRMDRGGIPDLYTGGMGTGFAIPYMGSKFPNSDLVLVATGIMVHKALEVAEELDATLMDVWQLKPLQLPAYLLQNAKRIVTVEEHQLMGGLGSIVAELLVDSNLNKPLLRLGIPDQFTFAIRERDELHTKYNLDKNSLVRRISDWMK